MLEQYWDSDSDSPTYLKDLNTYNPLFDMNQGSFDETTSFGFRNNFEIDWQVMDGLQGKGTFQYFKVIGSRRNF